MFTHPGMRKVFNTFWRAGSDELVILRKLELKASIISEILNLLIILLFSPIEIRKKLLAQNSLLSQTLICFPVFSLSQTDLAPKGITCKASSYGLRLSGVDSPDKFKVVENGYCA